MIDHFRILDQFTIHSIDRLMAQPETKTVPERALHGQLTEEERSEEVSNKSNDTILFASNDKEKKHDESSLEIREQERMILSFSSILMMIRHQM